MNAFSKTVRIGKIAGHQCSVFCRIEFDGKRLSISGVEGPKRDGNAFGSSGQIVMSGWEIGEYAPGWNADLDQKFRDVWDRWHLNDMKAGSPAQEQYLRANPVTFVYPDSHYAAALRALSAAGLHPDPADGYKYGNAWLYEEVPADVLEFLKSLPDTDITPNWV